MSNFRIQSKQLFLTIPQIDSSITKEMALERLKSHFTGKVNIDCMMVSHEKHKDEGDHLHIYINFNKIFQTVKTDYFDFIANKHPNIQSVKNRIKVIKYIMKDGDYITYNLDPQTYIQEVDNHEVRKSKGAFHELTQDIKDGMSYIELRNKHANLFVKYAKHIKDYMNEERSLKSEEDEKKRQFEFYKNIVWKQWQEQILAIVDKDVVDNRTIHWIYDKTGNKGKSTLANYLEMYKDAYIFQGGKHADLYRHYNYNKVVIYDLPRDYTDNNDSLYATMECLKNGYILDTKYEGQKKRFRPPHIFVFSNSLPNVSKLSKDRWNIIDLDDVNKVCKEGYEIVEKPIENNEIDCNVDKALKYIDSIVLDEEIEYMKDQVKDNITKIVELGLVHNKCYYGRYTYNKYTNKLCDSHLIEWLPLS